MTGLMAKASVFVDNRETTLAIGEMAQPIASGAVGLDFVRGDLYDLSVTVEPVRASAEEITVFKNGGGAHLDLMIAAYIAEVAASIPSAARRPLRDSAVPVQQQNA
jgi:ornithine cyclodeaminase